MVNLERGMKDVCCCSCLIFDGRGVVLGLVAWKPLKDSYHVLESRDKGH